MKKLQLLFIALALGTVSLCSAAAKPAIDFASEVKLHLENLPLEIEHEVTLNVKFSLNEKNEIIVNSVDADNAHLKKIITQRLSHQKMYSRLDPSIKEYTLPVRIKP